MVGLRLLVASCSRTRLPSSCQAVDVTVLKNVLIHYSKSMNSSLKIFLLQRVLYADDLFLPMLAENWRLKR